jgi:hypothetical protein
MFKQKFITSLFFIAVLFSASYMYAQDQDPKPKKTPEERAATMADRMKKNLELTDEQYNSVYPLLLEAAKQKDADREQIRAIKQSAKERFEKNEASLKEILTPDQFNKYQEHKKKMLEKRKMKLNRKKND